MTSRQRLRAKLQSPRFKAFEAQRSKELIAQGMPRMSARSFARREVRGRARASLTYSDEQALSADLEIIETQTGRPTFRLVYVPAP